MPRSTKSIRGKYLLVLLAAITACVSMGLVLWTPRVALATGAGGGKLEQLRQAYEDAQVAYEVAEQNEIGAGAEIEGKANDLSAARARAEALQAQADIINRVSAKKDLDAAQDAYDKAVATRMDAEAALASAEEAVRAAQGAYQDAQAELGGALDMLNLLRLSIANERSIDPDAVTDEMIREAYPNYDYIAAVKAAEARLQAAADGLWSAEQAADNTRNTYSEAQSAESAAANILAGALQAYDDALGPAEQARAALAESLSIDVSLVTDDFVAGQVAETWLEVDAAQAAYDKAVSDHEAAVKALEDTRAARDAAKDAYENYDPSSDSIVIPATGDDTSVVPIALLSLASLAALAAARRRQVP